jgi:sortase A
MTWLRKLGVVFVAAGVLLLAFYLVPTLYGAAMAHVAVTRFRMQGGTNRLWDSARIRAYQRTLGIAFAPPEAILRVPSAGIEVPVLEGTSDLILNRGVGHIPGTALPGQPGNLVITGHRDGFFRALKDVVPGDAIDIERPGGRTAQDNSTPRIDHYIVRSMKVVLPSDTSVLKSTTSQVLTLVTCYPFYFVGAAPERYVVQAALLPADPDTTSSTLSSTSARSAHPTSGD